MVSSVSVSYSFALLWFVSIILTNVNAINCYVESATSTKVCTMSYDITILSKRPDGTLTPLVDCNLDEKNFLTERLDFHIDQLANSYYTTTSIAEERVIKTLSPTTLPLPTDSPKLTYPPTNPPTNRPIPSATPTSIPNPRYPPTNRPTNRPTYYAITLVTKAPTLRTYLLPKPLGRRHLQSDPTAKVQASNEKLRTPLRTMETTKFQLRRKLGATFIWGGSSSWTCRSCGYDNQDLSISELCKPPTDAGLLMIYGQRCVSELELRMSTDLTILMNDEITAFRNNSSQSSSDTIGCLSNSELAINFIEKNDI